MIKYKTSIKQLGEFFLGEEVFYTELIAAGSGDYRIEKTQSYWVFSLQGSPTIEPVFNEEGSLLVNIYHKGKELTLYISGNGRFASDYVLFQPLWVEI